MAEFNRTAKPTLAPARCTVCHSQVGPMIDTYITVPGHGHIYLCGPNEKRSGCVGQMAAKFGYLAPENVQELRDELEALKSQIEETGRQIFTFTLSDGKLIESATAGSSVNRKPARVGKRG